jgi:hypothetical protein
MVLVLSVLLTAVAGVLAVLCVHLRRLTRKNKTAPAPAAKPAPPAAAPVPTPKPVIAQGSQRKVA